LARAGEPCRPLGLLCFLIGRGAFWHHALALFLRTVFYAMTARNSAGGFYILKNKELVWLFRRWRAPGNKWFDALRKPFVWWTLPPKAGEASGKAISTSNIPDED